MNILTVGIVTAPFSFEGRKKTSAANVGIAELKESCDTVLVILNDKLREIHGNLAISKAFEKLKDLEVQPLNMDVKLDGGLHAPAEFIHQEAIIKGDTKERAIAFASIVAKVVRDTYMEKIAEEYPEYRFDQHKGYGTKQHRASIKKHGTCDLHRKTWIH